jgi:uncharacterized protein (TIGR00369 family)
LKSQPTFDSLDRLKLSMPNDSLPPQPLALSSQPSQEYTKQPLNHAISAIMHWLGGELIEWGPQLTRVRFALNEKLFDISGHLQAGIITAMFDCAIDACAFAHDQKRRTSTLELSTHYFRSLRSGYIVLDATVLRAGHSTIAVEALAWDAGNELCAKAMSTRIFV